MNLWRSDETEEVSDLSVQQWRHVFQWFVQSKFHSQWGEQYIID